MSLSRRLSFAIFLAKLAAVGVGKLDRLCGIALSILRESLGASWPRGRFKDQAQSEDSSRLDADLSIAAILSCINAFIGASGLNIIQMAEKPWNVYSPAIVEPGPSLRDSQDG
ncbi:putative Transcription factor domain-containing protein [Seiridium unicorne]|uniref:Transcription factor domain-containing protein n=1 Tax=Seiridium unicorne TaxID=138068 RepID=A0ABR2USI8_9PEZI